MKSILIVLVFPFLLNAQEKNTPVDFSDWHTDYNIAIDRSKDNGKNLLVYFTGSDWCGPCIKLKKDLFKTDEFITISKEFNMLYIDIPRKKNILSGDQLKHNMALLPKLNKKGVFPHFTVLNSNEDILDEFSGYNMDGEIGSHLAFLEKNK
ncbi:MAG: thioredoxin family protein [Aurantibacter sp.]